MNWNGRSDFSGRFVSRSIFGGSLLFVFWSFVEGENGGSYRSCGMNWLRYRRKEKSRFRISCSLPAPTDSNDGPEGVSGKS
jgi:hypothetical protein